MMSWVYCVNPKATMARKKNMSTENDAFSESWRIQEEVSALGFDWPSIDGVFAKVREELGEIELAWTSGEHEHARRELGDLLFATVNLARFLKTDPRAELHRTNQRFMRRFSLLKELLQHEGRIVEECSLEELDAVWDRAKKILAREA